MLKEKVDVLEHAEEDREKTIEIWMKYLRSLGCHW
jgi:hypothetical protein